MNRKLAQYVTAGIVLGLAMMLLPVALLPPSPYKTGLTPTSASRPFSYNGALSGKGGSSLLAIVARPPNLVATALIVLAGLIAAFIVYVMAKKGNA